MSGLYIDWNASQILAKNPHLACKEKQRGQEHSAMSAVRRDEKVAPDEAKRSGAESGVIPPKEHLAP